MKNLFKSLMLVAVAAMAFTACQSDADIDQSGIGKVEGTTITVSAGFNEETRAYLVDGDGEFLVRWDSEDSVIFQATATDGTTTYAHATEPTLINDGESAEFTATFPKEIKTGTVKAYIRGYYYYSYESYQDYWSGTYVEYHNFYPQGLNYQYPEQDAPGYIVASAEFEYNGEELISEPVTFNHEFGYGKVTIKDDVEAHSMTLMFNDGNYTYRLQDLSNIEGNTFWFVADPMKVSTMDITLNTMDGRTMIKSVDMSKVENPLDFEAGKVSTFALQNFGVKLEQPYGTATVSEGSIVFDWNDVENATSYDIVLTKEYSEVIYSGSVTASEYAATGLENSTYYSLSIVAKADGYVDSDVCELGGTTPATRADLDAWKNDEVTFTYMRQLTAENDNIYLSNAYLFSTREITGKPTQDDTFMYLAFGSNVDLTQSGVYDIYDLDYIWLPDNIVDGWYGYTDNYSLGWKPYHFYPNSGDTYQVYVDVVDGETTITVYASCNWWSNIHFKGTWSSANTPEQPVALDTPVVSSSVNGNEVVVSWSAINGAANYTVTLGTQSQTVNGTTVTFSNLEYSTSYTVSVVANPVDTTANLASDAGTATFTTEADPNAGGNEGGNDEWTGREVKLQLLAYMDNALYTNVNNEGKYFMTSFRNGIVEGKFVLAGDNKSVEIMTSGHATSQYGLFGGTTPFADGDTVEVINNGGGSYTIIYRVTINGEKLTATYTGGLQ